ncbi:hypothetical protein [Evansella halocellulosilytica]|uniref:hypothetical protein n=1 Tax=Evansella halocellulosilytica TaxID=2011013 RepID=UPI000BB8BAD5|nr:hypothetical protein [Evansella halocellulosilytica]
MEFIEDKEFYTFIPVDVLMFIFLIILSYVYWNVSKRVGFQLLYLTLFSIVIAHIITLYFPYLYTNEEHIPLTVISVQATMTFFAFFMPLAKNRSQLVLTIGLPLSFSLFLLLMTEVAVFSIIGGIFIGGFIIYTFYRTLDWIGSMPEPYLFAFSMILPLFLAAIIYPRMDYLLYPGILLGSGIGVTLEIFKVRLNNENNHVAKRLVGLLIGIGGLVIFYGIDQLVFPLLPFPELTKGIVVGLWITLLVPGLLIMLKLYGRKGKSRVFS